MRIQASGPLLVRTRAGCPRRTSSSRSGTEGGGQTVPPASSPPATAPSSSSRTSTTSSPRPRSGAPTGAARAARRAGLAARARPRPAQLALEAEDEGEDRRGRGGDEARLRAARRAALLARHQQLRAALGAGGGRRHGAKPRRQPLREHIARSRRWSTTRASTSTWARRTTSSGACRGRIEFDVPEDEPRGLGGIEGGLARVLGGVRRRERRPGDRGAGERAAAVGAHPLARRRQPARRRSGRRAVGHGGAPATRAPQQTPGHRRRPADGAGAPERARTSRPTPTASTRRGPRTPRRSSAAPSCCLPLGQTAAGVLRRSRSGSMPQRRASSACCRARASQRSGRSSPSWSGVAPFSSIEPVLSPMARIAATSSSPSSGTRPARRQLGALALDRLGVRPGSWISVGRHALDRRRGRGSTRRRAGAASARGARRSGGCGRAARARLDPAVGAEAAVVGRRELVPG